MIVWDTDRHFSRQEQTMGSRKGHKCSFKHVKFAIFTFGGDLLVTFAVFNAVS